MLKFTNGNILFKNYYITYINNVNLFASNILLTASFCDIMMQMKGNGAI